MIIEQIRCTPCATILHNNCFQILGAMAPRVGVDEEGTRATKIHNYGVRGLTPDFVSQVLLLVTLGLAIYDPSLELHILSNFRWKFISELKDTGMGLIGYHVSLKVLKMRDFSSLMPTLFFP